ncbi:CHAD domain-containing protein [Planosporangium mesophilum]|uniref:CHAD domain-containing protein n=1 Tax=Planosporangium mesophilum TaxID=689768 RepID=A0A8J3T6S6_9ACTN|nr:CYTH and CHAD domain-containing protein [Planosporangium mesophilum]GII20708.1 CHAD domain-containing protein [Planosporangium mesophilum]
MLEEERKFEVDPAFAVPDLTGCLPDGGRVVAKPPVTLRATYYDTTDLRLARAGVSLRHRHGDDAPWTVKLPTDTTGIRREISRTGRAGAVPGEFVRLLTALHRGAPLAPSASMRTVRRRYDLCDADDQLLAEIADDTVRVLSGRRVASTFREVEVERYAGRRALLNKVADALREAGAVEGDFVPKHVRAMGIAATTPPDLTPPSGRVSPKASAANAITETLRRDIGRIFGYDPLVRLREPLPDGDTAVHRMRVGCRRLRSDLRTFRPLLDRQWADGLRADVKWLADLLGGARDAEVLRSRLERTAGTDPLASLDETALTRFDADLADRQEEALSALEAALDSPRYLELLERLLAAARAPRLQPAADAPARKVLPGLVRKPWRRLGKATALSASDPDGAWHAARVRGKRARYAVDAVAAVLGSDAADLAEALADVQDLLGEHQDAAVAADTWLAISQTHAGNHALAVTAGRLYERERAAIRRVREMFPAVWKAANKPRLTAWLPS